MMETRCGCRHEQLLRFIEESTDVIYETTLNGVFTYVNGAVRETLGYEPHLLIGRPYTDLVADEARASTVRHYRWQFETRTPSTYLEFPVMKADGSIAWFGQSVQTVFDNGRVVGFRVFARDITERRQAEEERRAIEERFHTFMDNIPAVAFVKDAAGRFIYVNEMLRRVFDNGSKAALNAESSRAHDREVLATGKPVQVLESITMPDGQVRQWLACKFPMPSKNGTTYVGCVTIDLTDRIALETDLAAARDAALASAKQKSEFLANMSHEIRTPMNGVLGLLGILLDGDLTDDQRDLADTARSSAESLLTIINDILDFSKMEAGKLTFEVLEFDVRKTVDSVIDLMSDGARRKSLDMGCIVDPDVPSVVRGDAARFRQVLLNLVGNAIKFTDHGGVIVQVDRESGDGDSIVLRCRVTDSGIGIPADALGKLFEPFVQADSSTTRLFGGTGLGLAISRQLVHMMEGEIGVETEPECGSSFSFTAKFERSRTNEEPAGNTAYAVPRVLIVDDSPMTRQIMSLQLTALGISNDMADDSISALSMLRDAASGGKAYDVIISDLNMPRTNGVTLARLVKADLTLMRPRFILLTSSAPRFDAAALAELGVTACISKPARRQHLFSALLGGMPLETARPAAGPARRTATIRPRILVADDSAVNQKVAIRQLEKLGYAADAVANGAEALEALERIAYHAVLMDCHMPEMDGFAATAEIRRRESGTRRHTPVIALTASATERDRQRCLDAGMDDYVTKPTREPNLAAALQRVDWSAA
jgi:PAS domain S-box-containing protein